MTEFHKSQYAEAENREIRETQKRGVEKNMRGLIVIGKGGCQSKSAV